MANIDRADWHYGGNFPDDLPQENGGTHIGMYLAWILDRGLGSRKLLEYAAPSLEALRARTITGRQVLFDELDEKFFSELLTKDGKKFTDAYYESQLYFADYDNTLGGDLPTLYHVADTWENYDRIAAVIDQRFAQWRNGETLPTPVPTES